MTIAVKWMKHSVWISEIIKQCVKHQVVFAKSFEADRFVYDIGWLFIVK